uniref:Uncharacterized protein n=1 Tax=Avena sativa TaxID=4498 RepID=A0ACD5ZIK6_AVESA
MAASLTTGVMKPLLGKLTGVRKQAAFLRDELSAMQALLEKMELMDKLDPSAKNWRDHVREMSYDMENCIDDFMHEIDGADAKTGFVKKMAKRLRRLWRRRQIANGMEELKVLAVEANDRRERYKIDDCISSSPGVVAVDPRMSVMYREASGLVGIDGPSEELVSLLMDSQKQLKVVSIVGLGGLGKTTLAKQVYDGIGGQFDRKAFVSVSQRPDVKSLLLGLQRKLGMEESSHAHELQEIVDCVREYLKHKRYFILVDDLWDQQAWDIISCAFPENSNGSRVVVTTRIDEVALWACHSDRANIYRMKQLEEQDSRRLFVNRVFGPGNVCPPQFKEISDEILKKCGGLPLAIITIASLVASHEPRTLREWECIKNSLGSKFATKPTLEEMRGILNLSYMHLPVRLRPCFLCLGMYPEDSEIMRDDLVRQWIAEGLIYSLHKVDLEDVAKSYFNELINKSLIQPGRTTCGEVVSCRVHDMLLDLILSKSTEDNFISVAYNSEDMARLHSCEDKVRRLSLQSSGGGATSEALATSMSQVRSVAWFRGPKYTPHLSQFKYLRVLLFEFQYQPDTIVDLTAIGHLFLLRYLKVFMGTTVMLPTEIKGLVHLETLELVSWLTQIIPSDISFLTNLFHLNLPRGNGLPVGIQNMKSVRTLGCLGWAESSLEDIKGLSQLTDLKELNLDLYFRDDLMLECADALVSSIGMLRDLKHLNLYFHIESDGLNNPLDKLHDPPPFLEVLKLPRPRFSRFPRWIGELCCLRILSLDLLQLTSFDVRVLGELPSLAKADFRGFCVSQDKVVISTGLFPVLEDVTFWSDEQNVTAYLSLEAGAMPKLQRLTLGFNCRYWTGISQVDMECLPCLQEIKVHHFCDLPSSRCLDNLLADVESAFKGAASVHPRHPSLTMALYFTLTVIYLIVSASPPVLPIPSSYLALASLCCSWVAMHSIDPPLLCNLVNPVFILNLLHSVSPIQFSLVVNLTNSASGEKMHSGSADPLPTLEL